MTLIRVTDFWQVETPRPFEDQKTTKTVDAMLEEVTLVDKKKNATARDSVKPLKIVTGDTTQASVGDGTMKTIEI